MDTIGVLAATVLIFMDSRMGRQLALTSKQKEEIDAVQAEKSPLLLNN